MVKFWSLIGVLLSWQTSFAAGKAEAHTVIDIWGNRHTLSEFTQKETQAWALVFVGTQCPLAAQYIPRAIELHSEYEPRGIQFLLVYSNAEESLNASAFHALEFQTPFPVLKDFHSELASTLKVERTPEVVLVSTATSQIVYRGRMDDQYWPGGRKSKPNKEFLRDAMDAFLKDPLTVHRATTALGCIIDKWTKPTAEKELTFHKDIAPIAQAKCRGCHREGEIGRFNLVSYGDFKRKAATIAEVIELDRMPPWHVYQEEKTEKKFGRFSNDLRLTPQERKTLLAWIYGERKEGTFQIAEKPPELVKEWHIGQPDKIITMEEEFEVPEDGDLEYQYFRVTNPYDHDVWIQAAEAQAGNREVVHHINVHISSGTDTVWTGIYGLFQLFGFKGEKARLLASYIPGNAARHYPPGYAVLLQKDQSLVFEVHYTPIGKKGIKDRSRVGIVLAKGPPEFSIRSHLMVTRQLHIPAGQPLVREENSVSFKENIKLLSVRPHLHKLGKHFEYFLDYPDGTSERLLTVARWDYEWQSIYEFEKPVYIPAGTEIRAVAYWDNSVYQPVNAGITPADVRWGMQTYEEMFNGGLTYVIAK